MYFNNQNINDDDLVANDNKFLKKHGNIYISDEQLNILEKYNIDIQNYNDVSKLIYDIEEILNSSCDVMDDLEWVSETLSEYNYYNNTNK